MIEWTEKSSITLEWEECVLKWSAVTEPGILYSSCFFGGWHLIKKKGGERSTTHSPFYKGGGAQF